MKRSRLLGAVCGCACATLTTAINAALLSRLDGQAYYDDVMDTTWMTNADANNGVRLTWFEATNWASSLNISGVTGWRLPNMDVNGDTVIIDCFVVAEEACRDNEFGYLYHQNGVNAANPAPFSDTQLTVYWSKNEADSANIIDFEALLFAFVNNGFQDSDSKLNVAFSWAIHDGDVEAVPIPAAFYLFGTGLLGLIGIARRKTT